MQILNRAKSKLRRDGLGGLVGAIPSYLRSTYSAQRRKLKTIVYKRKREMYSIYEEEWDLLIVLDGCRYDLLTEINDGYDFLSDRSSRYSPASSSRAWLEQNFDPQYSDDIASTVYVTGNPFTKEVLNDSAFATLDEVWRYAWDQKMGTIPPRPLTDRAIEAFRTDPPERCIVHYMQPHFPALSDPELGGKIDKDRSVWIKSVWDRLERDEIERSVVWEAYRQNLHDVLDDVALLLQNVDAERVVITADHGNGFGEDGIYGHPSKEVHDVLRKVPWIQTSAHDSGTHKPANYETESERSVHEKLSALGYVPE
jgi:hypothetical protein